MYVCVWAVCVLTVWVSGHLLEFRDPAFPGGRHLFETQHLLEVLQYLTTIKAVIAHYHSFAIVKLLVTLKRDS